MQEIVDFLSGAWADFAARPEGPYAFRFVLQPLMALLLAVRDGVVDARTGRSPYFWTVLHDAGRRRERLAEAVRATAMIGALALVLDAAWQWRVLHTFYPDEALAVALVLGLLPYLLLRGPADRVARRWIHRNPSRDEPSSDVPPGTTA